MHDIKAIRENPDKFIEALGRRGIDAAAIARSLIALDEKRRAAIQASEQAQARRNAASKEIGEAKKAKDNARADALMAEVGELKTKLPELESAVKQVEEELKKELAQIPNLPLAEVPIGADEHGNVEHHRYGAKREYAFKPKEHVELGEGLKFMDFETAAKMSGARFVVLKKGLARLERAIGQFMLDLHTNEHGYAEVNPPLLVRDDAMFGTAQLPKFEDDQFKATRKLSLEDRKNIFAQIGVEDTQPDSQGNSKYHELIEEIPGRQKIIFSPAGLQRIEELRDAANSLWLIPTAEVPLTNLVRESILDEKELPMRLTALTQCFRAEAGAAGRDTRGMIRQHQFTKVELVSITTPEESMNEHERMLSCAEEVLKRLGLHYRVMTLCTGDMGFASQKTYDIEVWMPGQGEGGMYREISSCSVCGDFQARRMDARSRGPDGKPRFVHTLNGSGTAVGRALIAVMETYQQEDGSIAVPDVLQPYMGGLKVIAKDN
ncbi:serine--tRNA ligase [Bradyrhizobium sp. G127]|uniref:serine--tRNA ligase n=1 Tax=Bradyrhizobium sp. G127 TaxID=2904800 RepID=UPI001EFF8BF9|nr:serine--tRNA ligase [Bradyrhizobium sp. G127]MCF2523731.1 serine--tRNA ligase [Bradyrhizobium sp. G127]